MSIRQDAKLQKQGHAERQKGTTPFQTNHIKHIGPFPRSRAGERRLFATINVQETKTAPVVKFLQQNFFSACQAGLWATKEPDSLQRHSSNSKKNWTLNTYIEYMATLRANRQIEMYNAMLHQALVTNIIEEGEWLTQGAHGSISGSVTPLVFGREGIS